MSQTFHTWPVEGPSQGFRKNIKKCVFFQHIFFAKKFFDNRGFGPQNLFWGKMIFFNESFQFFIPPIQFSSDDFSIFFIFCLFLQRQGVWGKSTSHNNSDRILLFLCCRPRNIFGSAFFFSGKTPKKHGLLQWTETNSFIAIFAPIDCTWQQCHNKSNSGALESVDRISCEICGLVVNHFFSYEKSEFPNLGLYEFFKWISPPCKGQIRHCQDSATLGSYWCTQQKAHNIDIVNVLQSIQHEFGAVQAAWWQREDATELACENGQL